MLDVKISMSENTTDCDDQNVTQGSESDDLLICIHSADVLTIKDADQSRRHLSSMHEQDHSIYLGTLGLFGSG